MKDKRMQMHINYGDTEYNLYFTASSLKKMEQRGFKFGKMDDTILTAGEELFSGLFIAEHDNVPKKKRLEIYHALAGEDANGENLNDFIGEMLNEAIEEMNSHQGNVSWTGIR